MSVSGATQRARWLDAGRGFVIANMIMVDVHEDLGGDSFAAFSHSRWNGFNWCDQGIHAFIVASSASFGMKQLETLSSVNMTSIFKRASLIFALGVALNVSLMYLHNEGVRDLRFPGVLQRYAISHAMGMFLYVKCSRRMQLFVVVVSQLLYICLWYIDVSSACQEHIDPSGSQCPECNGIMYIDNTVFGSSHLSRRWTSLYSTLPCGWRIDGNGIIPTVTSVLAVLAGIYYGVMLRHPQMPSPGFFRFCVQSCIAGFVTAAACLLSFIVPFNWTLSAPPLQLLAIALVFQQGAIFELISRFSYVNRLLGPLRVLGRHPMFVFLFFFLMQLYLLETGLDRQIFYKTAWPLTIRFVGEHESTVRIAKLCNGFLIICFVIIAASIWEKAVNVISNDRSKVTIASKTD
eukprot:GILJ01008564.1.p1 GENE.GILJ01008564.1~~GILJ01008564.1.p1  ORF type:complete len:405 (+),score=24.83 GILJ01008564.1:59-1273(+)